MECTQSPERRTRLITMGVRNKMTTDTTKGQKLIHGVIHNWLDETHELPTNQDIVSHIFSMNNEEFDAFLNQQDYLFRKEMHEEGERQQKAHEDKKVRNQKKKNKVIDQL